VSTNVSDHPATLDAQRQGQLAQIIALERQDIEGIKLHLVIMLVKCSLSKSETLSMPSSTPSPSITNEPI
jgi:hypothetical protein